MAEFSGGGYQFFDFENKEVNLSGLQYRIVYNCH